MTDASHAGHASGDTEIADGIGNWSGSRGAILAVDSGYCIRIADMCGSISNPAIEADAEFIITACNSHDALVAENERLREALQQCQRTLAMMIDGKPSGPAIMSAFANCVEAETKARAALARRDGVK